VILRRSSHPGLPHERPDARSALAAHDWRYQGCRAVTVVVTVIVVWVLILAVIGFAAERRADSTDDDVLDDWYGDLWWLRR